MKKFGTLIFEKTKEGLKLSGSDLYDIYSTSGVPPYRILELLREQIKKEYESEIECLDKEIEYFKNKI